MLRQSLNGTMISLTMTTIANPYDAVSEAVDATVKELVSSTRWRDGTIVSVPLLYPGGTNVVVKISIAPVNPKRVGTFAIRVSDFGSAFREMESVGLESAFVRSVSSMVESHDIQHTKQSIFQDITDISDLYGAVCSVSSAAWKAVSMVYDRIAVEEVNENDLRDALRQKLQNVFGFRSVSTSPIIGASSKSWEVSAVVAADKNRVAFQAVKSKAQSVYKTMALFSDIARTDVPFGRVAVLPDLHSASSEHLNMLQQTGRVLGLEADGIAFERAAA